MSEKIVSEWKRAGAIPGGTKEECIDVLRKEISKTDSTLDLKIVSTKDIEAATKVPIPVLIFLKEMYQV